MTLEQLLTDNTAAMNRLADSFDRVLQMASDFAQTNLAQLLPTEESAPEPEQPAEAPVEKEELAATATPVLEQAPAEDKPLSYDDAAQALTDLMKTGGRDKAVEVLAKFGAKNLKGVKPEDYAAFIEATKG